MAVQGHPRSLTLVPIESAYATQLFTLAMLVINCNLGPILPRFRDIAGFLLRTTTPPLFHWNFGVFPLDQIRAITFELSQLIWPRYINVTDGRTDRQTDGRTDDLLQQYHAMHIVHIVHCAVKTVEQTIADSRQLKQGNLRTWTCVARGCARPFQRTVAAAAGSRHLPTVWTDTVRHRSRHRRRTGRASHQTHRYILESRPPHYIIHTA